MIGNGTGAARVRPPLGSCGRLVAASSFTGAPTRTAEATTWIPQPVASAPVLPGLSGVASVPTLPRRLSAPPAPQGSAGGLLLAPPQPLPTTQPFPMAQLQADPLLRDWTLVNHVGIGIPGGYEFKVVKRSLEQERAPPLDIAADTVEILFVRHGLSLNNTFKEDFWENAMQSAKVSMLGVADIQQQWGHESATRFQRGYVEVCYDEELCGDYTPGAESSLAWEIGNMSRDGLLHPDGKSEARAVGMELLRVLPANFHIERFYTSPLRRTIETLFAMFTSHISRVGNLGSSPQVPYVLLQPWLHERYNSDSDLALDAATTSTFIDRIAHTYNLSSVGLKAATSNLQKELIPLGDWVRKSGKKYPESEEDRFPVEPEGGEGYMWSNSDDSCFPFYPRGVATWVESEPEFEERMMILRRWLVKLKPGKRYVLVSHGRIAAGLFKDHAPNGTGMLTNNGVVVAQYKPAVADPEDAAEFFSDVQLGSKRWDCDIPGWEEEDD